jgi:hypothetical protein
MRNPMTADRSTARAVEPAALVMRWVPVTDEAGRTRMEARWQPAPAAASSPTPHAA